MASPSPTELSGSCACERNQYTILVPSSSATQAQVFFDNSAANRRSQATPLTAWLRVPLAWYHSRTFALFPDETHASIRRTFHTASSRGDEGVGAVTRRQFCGYCGTHLSAWDEGQTAVGGDGDREGEEWMDVTLGSLMDESLRELEGMGVLGDSDDDDEVDAPDDDEGEKAGGRDVTMSNTGPTERRSPQAPHTMRNRGMPFFESLVENSRLGRIKRQKGGHMSADGRRMVEWEVVEIEGEEGVVGEGSAEELGEGRSKSKKPRLEP